VSPLQKGFRTAKHAKVAKKKQTRKSFFKVIRLTVRDFHSVFEFPLYAFVSFVFKKVFSVDSLVKSVAGILGSSRHIVPEAKRSGRASVHAGASVASVLREAIPCFEEIASASPFDCATLRSGRRLAMTDEICD